MKVKLCDKTAAAIKSSAKNIKGDSSFLLCGFRKMMQALGDIERNVSGTLVTKLKYAVLEIYYIYKV